MVAFHVEILVGSHVGDIPRRFEDYSQTGGFFWCWMVWVNRE